MKKTLSTPAMPPAEPGHEVDGRERVHRAGDSPPRDSDELSLIGVINILLRHRRVVVLAPLATAALLVGLALISPREYTATATFLPQSAESQISRFAGLAAQLGITIPRETSAESPEFYADLIQSREILESVVQAEYRSHGAGGEGPAAASLVELYRVRGNDAGVRVSEAVRKLSKDLVVRVRRETGVVELSVTSRWPTVASGVAERFLELVSQFNLETRRSQASAERQFVEARLEEARGDLERAEDELRLFLEQNRRYENSPELSFEHDRLQRRVSLRQEVYTSLSQSFEQAKIEEVRNTPVITLVEAPAPPVRPDRRGLVTKGLLGLFLGGLVGVFWGFGREVMVGTSIQAPGDYAEFTRLRGEVARELSRAWRRLRRPWRRGAGGDGGRGGGG